MRTRFSFNAGSSLGLAGILLTILLGTLRDTPSTQATNIAASVWEATAGGSQIEVLVILKEQADLTPAKELPTRDGRLRYAYDALRATARRSQTALRAALDSGGVTYRSYYIVNMIALQGDRDLLTLLG